MSNNHVTALFVVMLHQDYTRELHRKRVKNKSRVVHTNEAALLVPVLTNYASYVQTLALTLQYIIVDSLFHTMGRIVYKGGSAYRGGYRLMRIQFTQSKLKI